LLGSEGSEELILLFGSLEATVTQLGGGIDKLKVDLLGHPVLGAGEDGLSENDSTLLGSHDLTLHEDVILVDFTVMWETTHGGDVLLDGISSASSVVLGTTALTSTHLVDLLVDLGSGMVTGLTDTADCPFDSSWMPSTDTTNAAETSMSLTLQFLDTVTVYNTLGSVTLGNTNSVNALVFFENFTNSNLLFELAVSPVNLLGDITTVNLDLHNVSLMHSQFKEVVLGSAENSDGRGVLLDTGDVTVNGVLVLLVNLVLFGVLGVGLVLRVSPVLVESTHDLLVHLLSHNSLEGTEATGGLDVSDHTDNLHWGALNDGGGVNDVLLENLLTVTAFEVFDAMSHTGLEAHKGGQVDGFGRIVTGEVPYATTVMLCSSLGDKAQGAVPGRFKLTVRHSIY